MKPSQIRQKFDTLFAQRKSLIEETWSAISKYIDPMRNANFFEPLTSENEVRFKEPERRDVTATVGADLLAANINSAMTSFSFRWFELGFRNPVLKEDNDARAWLETCADIMFSELYDSNFATEVQEAYLDLVMYGNSVMTQEASAVEWDGVKFDNIPVREFYFEEDQDGRPLNVYRLLQWPASKIVDRFGIDKVPESVKKAYKAADNNKIDVIFCIYRRFNVPLETSGMVAPEKRPFGYAYTLRNGKGDHTLEEGGYYENPAYITRWRKTSGSQWGYGPGNVAIPAVQMINTTIDIITQQAELDLAPPLMTTPRGLIGKFDYSSRAINKVRSIADVQPFQTGTKADLSLIVLEDLRQQVRSIFMTDQLQLKESPAMSATEAQIRFEMMNRLLGPTSGLIQNDLLSPMLQRTFNQIARAGRFPEPPPSVTESGEAGKMDIEYTGPLARAQRLDAVMTTERWAASIANLSEAYPEMRLIVDAGQLARNMAYDMGVDATNLRSKSEFEAAVTKQQQAAAAQQAAETANTASQAAVNVQKAEGEAP